MADYKKMYLGLFREVSHAVEILQKAQQESERVFIEGNEPELTIIEPEKTE